MYCPDGIPFDIDNKRYNDTYKFLKNCYESNLNNISSPEYINETQNKLKKLESGFNDVNSFIIMTILKS